MSNCVVYLRHSACIAISADFAKITKLATQSWNTKIPEKWILAIWILGFVILSEAKYLIWNLSKN
ncbi:MAG: hypothetical protein SPJ83_06010 [Helicobacter sp.]|uniref:hypothetical protein n=1 Tax=Helicobacter sp. TaxID=218 RepID=UPI000CF140C1|nr:hypothetical protein [Helicobacter sp.]MDY5822338.1 hypothetical protein [Helicobacter sp.]